METMRHIVLLLIWMKLLPSNQCADLLHPESDVTSSHGHYPPMYCKYTHIVFKGDTGAFHYKSHRDLHKQCSFAGTDIWEFKKDPDLDIEKCTETYDQGHIFTIFYYYGSNYFHLHYDMMLPLFAEIMKTGSREGTAAFLPTVESERLKKLNWDTVAFDDDSNYWVQTVKLLLGKHDAYRPMNDKLRTPGYTICFKKAYFGSPRFEFDNRDVVRNFIKYAKQMHNITEYNIETPLVGIISRSNRRRILNEADVVKALSEIVPTVLIEFTGMTYREQVQLMQKYSVLIGMNGAGLMNALYLPKTSVAIQLVPYKAGLNFNEFGKLLKSRGPYIEWHNQHEELTVPMPGDPHRNRPDTILHIDEMKELVTEALELISKQKHNVKTEL
ncbi:unnamed protein product [Owenia fusiformis]|uniref:Glycosyltransferase 61 catalytic domain-containing protein n=1 Tax=Owenia fusiformis TaxID=6347 RepID=A0A8S4PVP2_OWEFU|nr:unnamed protein product [Owenia fusiformis]